MSKILNFLILAIKWLSKPISQIKTSSPEEKYVRAEFALSVIEMSAAYWLALSKQYWVITKYKQSKPLHEIHLKVQADMAKHDELKGFDLSKGNPFLYLMELKAMTRQELISNYGDRVVCIETKLLNRMMLVIITYNFFKKFKERAGEFFTKAEADMRELVEANKLPGRFSWNNFVDKVEKEKTVVDFSFMDAYNPATEDSSPETDSNENNPEASANSEAEQNVEKPKSQEGDLSNGQS
jgi:hypothetical protein